jgi:DNA-nicking Smr family endonuclease
MKRNDSRKLYSDAIVTQGGEESFAILFEQQQGMAGFRPKENDMGNPKFIAKKRKKTKEKVQTAMQNPTKFDFHGVTTKEVPDKVDQVLETASKNHWICIAIIVGRGHHSPGGKSPLRSRVEEQLIFLEYSKKLSTYEFIEEQGTFFLYLP